MALQLISLLFHQAWGIIYWLYVLVLLIIEKNLTYLSKIHNHVAGTHAFYRLIEKFFEMIIQLPVTDYAEKTANLRNSLARRKNNDCGTFGPVNSGKGIFEGQASGNLHFHSSLNASWNIKQIQRWLHDPAIKKQFAQLIDDHITGRIPNNLKTNIKNDNINLKDPHPCCNNIELNAVKYAARYNNHKHSHACWKNNANKCRLAMRQPLQKQTKFLEITADTTGNPT